MPGLPRLKAKRTIEHGPEALFAAIESYRERARARVTMSGGSLQLMKSAGQASGWPVGWPARGRDARYAAFECSGRSSGAAGEVRRDRCRGAVAHTDGLASGEPRVCSMVPVPSEADEDARRCTRERTELVAERVELVNRIGAVLATLGVRDYDPLRRDRRERLATLRTTLGAPLPPHASAKITRILDRLDLVRAQIAELEQQRDAVLEERRQTRPTR